MQPTPLHHYPNLDLVAIMPPVPRVVEAGASSGALARAYKEKHPDCNYLGIEIDPAFATIAQEHCDQVLVADLDGLTSLPPPNRLQAECWVFGDCLEHLIDPWRMLRWVYQLQPSNGVICACIPNAQHWSVQARLSTGNFFYERSGLMDRTHLRWFTRTTIATLFANSGYQLELLQPRLIKQEPSASLMDAVRAMARSAGGDPDRAESDARAFQYIVRARKQPEFQP